MLSWLIAFVKIFLSTLRAFSLAACRNVHVPAGGCLQRRLYIRYVVEVGQNIESTQVAGVCSGDVQPQPFVAAAEEKAAVMQYLRVYHDEPLAPVAVFLDLLENIRIVAQLDIEAWAAPCRAS